MYQVMIKEMNGSKQWTLDLEKSPLKEKRLLKISRAEMFFGVLFFPNKSDKGLQLMEKVLKESDDIFFYMSITEITQKTESEIFKNTSRVPKAGVPLVIVDFEGTIFSPVIYDADDQSWNYKESEIRKMIIKQWAYQSDLYPTLNLPATSEQEKRSIRHELEQQIKQEKDKKRQTERKLMEDLKQGLSKAFPDATIEINEIKMH